MATTDVALHEGGSQAEQKRVVNDMSIQVATVNGSGSQSSNTVLLRSIFQMGVPVSGKNLFPSNIAGLPTWYTIRANKDGYIARKKEIDFVVAMNPETAQEDVMSLAPGAAVLYDEPLNLSSLRSDLIFYAVPYDKLVAPVCPEAKLRKLVKNMIYVGVVAKLLEIDMAEVEKAIRKQFAKKVKAANLNLAAVKAGYDYAAANPDQARSVFHPAHGQDRGQDHHRRQRGCRAGLHVRRRDDGDLVSDHAIVFAAREHDRLHEALPHRRRRQSDVRHRAGGRRTGCHRHGDRRRLGWRARHDCHRRARHFADGRVRRPGLLRRGSRRDLGHPARRPLDRPAHAHLAGRHSFHRVPLAWRHQAHHADSVFRGRVLHHGGDAFDLAEQFQTPVFVMSDLDLGMNNWMADPFKYPEKPIKRGKVLGKEDLDRLGSFARYKDVDGDGIGYRTLPGTDHPAAAYFTRGSGHNEKAQYSERPDDFEHNMERLNRSSRPRGPSCRARRLSQTAIRRSASSPMAPRTGQ